MCSNKKYVSRPCGGGLHFDAKIKACNFPEKANCGTATGPIDESAAPTTSK